MANPNSHKTLILIGVGLLIISLIAQSQPVAMVFACLSGFLFLAIAVIKALVDRFSRPKVVNLPQKFWPIIGIFLIAFLGVCYLGNKNPPIKKQEVAMASTPTPILDREVLQQEIKKRLDIAPQEQKTTPTVTRAPIPTPTLSSTVTEDYVRKMLTESNNIIYKDSLVKIEIFDNYGTENNDTDKIVHVYFQPLTIWDEKEMISQSVEKAAKSMKVLFSNPQITHIVFWTLGEFTDSYGNNSQATALRIGLKSTTANKINWDNFIPMVEVDYKKLFDIADDKYVHPVIAKSLNLVWR